MFGNFDFNTTPLAPPGTQLIIHNKPNKRKSWDYHGEDGFYIGPVMNHYRCITTYVSKTHAERYHPEVNINDHLNTTGEKMIYLLKNKASLIT